MHESDNKQKTCTLCKSASVVNFKEFKLLERAVSSFGPNLHLIVTLEHFKNFELLQSLDFYKLSALEAVIVKVISHKTSSTEPDIL